MDIAVTPMKVKVQLFTARKNVFLGIIGYETCLKSCWWLVAVWLYGWNKEKPILELILFGKRIQLLKGAQWTYQYRNNPEDKNDQDNV